MDICIRILQFIHTLSATELIDLNDLYHDTKSDLFSFIFLINVGGLFAFRFFKTGNAILIPVDLAKKNVY